MDIKNYRKEAGLTQVQLAKVLKTSQGYIALIESGQRQVKPETAIEWEKLTKGKLKRASLRPDIWG